MKKVIVIGAGPAGMMAAMTAGKEHEVILLDGNNRLGKKLYITGNNLPEAGLSDREVCKRHCQWQCLLCL